MAYIVDMRSDTVTKPTESMKHAMVNSALGDDVYGEDPTVNALESKIANMLGKQASLFVPSGTMANLISLMVHCPKRGSEAIVGKMSHIFRYEQGGASHLASIMITTIDNKPDGTFDLDEFESMIRGSDIHEPVTALVAVENTHNACGGKVLPLDWLEDLSNRAKKHSIPIHMDGARLFNATEYMKLPASRLVRDVDSISICFSKGLACPAGSIIVGSYHFIEQARRFRKMLGGGMRQTGVLAAAAIVALDEVVPNLGLDHTRAHYIAKAITSLNLKYFTVDLKNVHSNIVMMKIDKKCPITAKQVVARLSQVCLAETQGDCKTTDGEGVILKVVSFDNKTVRFTTHYQITDQDMWKAIMKTTFVLKEFEGNCKK